MSRPNPSLFALYRMLLPLYPSRLRLRYEDEMLQSVCDASAERRETAPRFWLQLFADLLKSSIQERFLMIREQITTHPILVHALALGLILTLMGGAASAVFQGFLRSGADQPQVQMAEDYATGLAAGQRPEDFIPRPSAIVLEPQIIERGGHDRSTDPLVQVVGGVDIGRSLQPFAVVYDDGGKPIFFNGTLDQAVPTPPHGVFNYLRSHAVDRFTWQPRPGVRIATVARRVNGPHPGFVLAGRSLRVVEQQEGDFWRMVFIAWFVLVALLVGGAVFLSRVKDSIHPPAAAQAQ